MSETAAPLRLAMFAPMAPARSGIADYVRDLLPLLPEAWSIDLYGDPATAYPLSGAGTVTADEWAATAASPYDLDIYHLGNAVEHEWMVQRALRRPGLVVLHDAILHPARAAARLGAADVPGYRRAAEASGAGSALAHLVAGGLGSPNLYWRFPLCEDVVAASRLTVVHGELLAGWLGALVPGAAIGEVTHWRAVAPVDGAQVDQWRARLDAMSCPLIGAFGHAGTAHGLDTVLEALARLNADAPGSPGPGGWRAVIVGGVDPGLDLEARVSAAGLSGQVYCTGAVDDHDFAALLRAVDVGVNLRYPTARSSSGTLQQLLSLGVPVAITDLLHLRDLPDAAVARIPPTGDAPAMLAAALARWAFDPEATAAAGTAAAAWAAAEITPTRMAASYREAVGRAIAGDHPEGVVPCG